MKKVVNAYYVHVSNMPELLKSLYADMKLQVISACDYVENNLHIPYDVIKVDTKRRTVSFIQCITFNSFEEPIVGDSYCFNLDNLSYKVIKGGSKVYHHKWQFVSEDYKGFNVAASKRRSDVLNGIQEFKDNKSRIGNLVYWHDFLKRNGLHK